MVSMDNTWMLRDVLSPLGVMGYSEAGLEGQGGMRKQAPVARFSCSMLTQSLAISGGANQKNSFLSGSSAGSAGNCMLKRRPGAGFPER